MSFSRHRVLVQHYHSWTCCVRNHSLRTYYISCGAYQFSVFPSFLDIDCFLARNTVVSLSSSISDIFPSSCRCQDGVGDWLITWNSSFRTYVPSRLQLSLSSINKKMPCVTPKFHIQDTHTRPRLGLPRSFYNSGRSLGQRSP